MKKIIMSIFMLIATITSLVTSTFAFIVISDDAYIKDYDFNVEAQKGIQLSLDGVTYYNDIPANLIKEKIASSAKDYDNLKFTAVTLKQEGDAGLKHLVFKDKKAQFVKDELVANKDDKEIYEHVYKSAEANKDYIVFDLWIKMLNTNDTDLYDYKLMMTSNSDITSEEEIIKLDNTLTTMDKVYKAQEEINVKLQDAMRMAIDVNDSMKPIIYELHEGLGSHAIEGSTDPKHDKTKNAMYTYYNNIMWKYPLTVAGDEYLTNSKSDLTSQVFATFSNKTTKEVKLTFYIWLEGWDADFLIGMSTSARTAKINLGFEIKE